MYVLLCNAVPIRSSCVPLQLEEDPWMDDLLLDDADVAEEEPATKRIKYNSESPSTFSQIQYLVPKLHATLAKNYH